MTNYIELIEIQKEYIELLEKEMLRFSPYLAVHNISSSIEDIQTAQDLRDKIKELEKLVKRNIYEGN